MNNPSLIIIFFSLSLICHSQEKAFISILDTETFLPIEEVFVFQDDLLIDISCKNGICILDTNHCHILFVKQGYRTTSYQGTEIVFMEPTAECNDYIDKGSKVQIIAEVTIDEKYNARNHLSKMRDKSINSFKIVDTIVLYYRFNVQINIKNTCQREVFQGILKVTYQGYNQSSYTLDASFCKIELFENNIEDKTYEQIRPNFFNNVLNSNIMFDNSYKTWDHVIRRRNAIEKVFNKNDSVFFRSSRSLNNEEELIYHIGFLDNKVTFFRSFWSSGIDNPKSVPFNPFSVYNQYSLINYSRNFNILPQSIIRKESVILDNGHRVEYSIKIEQIEKRKDRKLNCSQSITISESNKQIFERIMKSN